jgi:hypothetical protein
MAEGKQIDRERPTRGFAPAAALIAGQVAAAGRRRGLGDGRLLAHWAEIAGGELSRLTRPVRLARGRGGSGATLTLACEGALAPVVQMRLPEILARVNAVLGPGAVARIVLAQSAGLGRGADAPGLAEPPATWAPAPAAADAAAPAAAEMVAGIADPGLRAALERLAACILARR